MEPVALLPRQLALLLSLFANFERFPREIKLSLKGGGGAHVSLIHLIWRSGRSSPLFLISSISLSLFFASEKRRTQAGDLI